MKLIRFCVVLLASTCILASCTPNGRENAHDTMAGTPSKADTVLPHKYHVNKGDSAHVMTEESEPVRLKR